MSDGERHRCVLLHQEDRHALTVDVADRVEDLLDQDRRQPHARLVQQEEPGVRHERTADREHLLLAAREGAGHLTDALGEPREEGEDALEVGGDSRVASEIGAHHQVLANREAVEDAATLGHVRHAPRDDRVRRHVEERLGLERDGAARRMKKARDRLERGRLSGAVVAEDRDDLAAAHLEPHALERPDLAVGDVERLDPKHAAPSEGRRRACRDRPRSHARLPGPRAGGPPRSSRRGRARSPGRTPP